MAGTLVVFAGLPGVGKTTISRALAARLGAVFLRIDEIEQAIQQSGIPASGIGPAGYVVAGALAVSNLRNGLLVVADCVNAVPESRQGWRDMAARGEASLLDVEIICSDRAEHQRRVEARREDIAGHVVPTWQSVMTQDFAPWPEPHLVIDTASLSPEEAITRICEELRR
jgi:predicted kinase